MLQEAGTRQAKCCGWPAPRGPRPVARAARPLRRRRFAL